MSLPPASSTSASFREVPSSPTMPPTLRKWKQGTTSSAHQIHLSSTSISAIPPTSPSCAPAPSSPAKKPAPRKPPPPTRLVKKLSSIVVYSCPTARWNKYRETKQTRRVPHPRFSGWVLRFFLFV